MKTTTLLHSLAFLTACFLCACGHYPPIVDSRRDVERLSAHEPTVRARGLPDDELSALEHLRELRNLNFADGWGVEDAKITDAGVARLAKLDLPKLNLLDLGFCDITDAGLAHVAEMPTVTMLLLMGCPKITDGGLPSLLSMKRLTYLDLRGCPGITDRGLEVLAKKSDWETLEFGGCQNVTAQAVARLQTALPNARVAKSDAEWEMSR